MQLAQLESSKIGTRVFLDDLERLSCSDQQLRNALMQYIDMKLLNDDQPPSTVRILQHSSNRPIREYVNHKWIDGILSLLKVMMLNHSLSQFRSPKKKPQIEVGQRTTVDSSNLRSHRVRVIKIWWKKYSKIVLLQHGT